MLTTLSPARAIRAFPLRIPPGLATCLVLALPAHAAAQHDWPQWRGPNRDDVSTETGLQQQWADDGPELVWTSRSGGDGYSGFAVSGDRLYTMGADADDEFVLCLNTRDGSELWRQNIDERFQNRWGDGPRSTPTVNGDRVYALSSNGTVACLKAGDGSVEWTTSLVDLGGAVPYWGYSESVLVDGDQVVCTPGGSEGAIVALDAATGKPRWQSTLFTEPAHYSSIIVADHPDKRHYVQLTPKAFVGIDPEDGSVLWKQDWNGKTAVIPTPIYHDRQVYVTSGYGVGSKLVDISDLSSPRQVWFSKAMKNHHGGVILVDGHLYGYSDQVGWICQSLADGEAVWAEKKALGKGGIGYADGRFYLVDEKTGDVALISASAEGWDEQGRFRLTPQTERRKPMGRIWVHPVISNGKLYLRDQEIIYCFDISSP